MGFMTENYLALGFSLVGVLVVTSMIVRRVADSYIQQFEKALTNSELNGREFVDRVLESEDIDVILEEVEGPGRGEFLLKEGIVKVPELENNSLLTLGISAHELAHASQFSQKQLLVATTGIFERLGAFLSYIFPLALIVGFIFYFPLLKVALVLYLFILLILLARIILEMDASRKALALLDRYGELTELELVRLKKLLGLAILTRLTDLTAGFLVLLDMKEKR